MNINIHDFYVADDILSEGSESELGVSARVIDDYLPAEYTRCAASDRSNQLSASVSVLCFADDSFGFSAREDCHCYFISNILFLTQLLDVTKDDPLMLMREKSVDFCYSEDEEDDDDHSTVDNRTVSGGTNLHDTMFFSPVGKPNVFSPHSFSPANTAEKKKSEKIGLESRRELQVLACGDDESDISITCVEQPKEAATPGKYGSLHIPALDRDGVYLGLGDDEERHRLMMEGILADQDEADGILTRHRGDLVETEPTPRSWLDATPTPPSFVSPVRAQQLEDAMNSAIDQVERTLFDFEQ